MDTWIEQTERRVAIVLDQMTLALSFAKQQNLDAEPIRNSYQRMLDRLYAEDMPYARVMDASDLVTRFEGPAVNNDPAVSLVSSLFGNLQKQVKHLVQALVSLETDQKPKWPSGVDLRLSGLAKGSLVIGVRLDSAQGAGSQIAMPEILDPLFDHVRHAIRSLSVVPHYLSDNDVSEHIREEIPDPAIRDALIVAAYGLSPTGRNGVDSVSIGGKAVSTDHAPSPLTPSSRRALRNAIETPTFDTRRGEFEGVVREIDLDAKRFEIRGVHELQALRCVFPELSADEARTWLNRRIIVRGLYESAPNGRARLMQVERVILNGLIDDTLPMDF